MSAVLGNVLSVLAFGVPRACPKQVACVTPTTCGAYSHAFAALGAESIGAWVRALAQDFDVPNTQDVPLVQRLAV